jgi:hypothetical protein
MKAYMYQPNRGDGIRLESNVLCVGPDKVLRCPATLTHKDCRIVCGHGFGKTNEYARAEIRVVGSPTAGLMRPGFLHRCKACKAQLEIIVLVADPSVVDGPNEHDGATRSRSA